MSGRRRILVSIVGVAALVAALLAIVLVHGSGSGERDRDSDEAGGASHEMREAMERHHSLAAKRKIPLAFVSEKLAQASGDEEASGEIQNGPNQESYDQRAFPKGSIQPAQQARAAQAFGNAVARAHTSAGRAALNAISTSPSRWTSVGPNGGLVVPEATYTGQPAYVSGRTTALATTGACSTASCTLYLGAAGGGLWKTTNALATTPTWTSIGDSLPSQAIGSITIGPSGEILVGTGEANGSSDNEAGVGLYKSTDGGKTFTKVTTNATFTGFSGDFTLNRGVGAVAIDPKNPQHIYVGTQVARHGASSVNGGRFTPPGAAPVGLFESSDGGATWRLALSEASDVVNPGSPNGSDFFRGGISKVAFDPTHAGVVYAAMSDYGLYRAPAAGGTFTRIYSINTPGDAATSSTNRVEFATATLPSGATRIYLGDATRFDDSVAGLLRTDDATTATPTWTNLSSATEGTPGYGSYNFCEGQCYYDMVVSSPPGKPDEVFLSGSMNYDELAAFGGPGDSNGRAVVRSADAGVHVTDMTNDIADHGLHPDHHALVFANTGTGPETFFSGSDGGVVAQSAPYVNRSSDCDSRDLSGAQLTDCKQYLSAIPTLNNDQINKGLQTLQYQSVSVTPSGVIQGGTQDNGTWESDQGGFAETVGGDGGQSGFNKNNASIRYHSYYNPQHDVSFTGGDATGWDWISDPLLNSGESASFYTPLTADPVTGGTVFDGLQHVWRTTDNGGSRAYLDQHCNELTGDFEQTCGDWVPLGGAKGDLSGGDAGNYVAAVERAPSNKGTLWAGTRKGGIYVSTNANAPAGSVKFTRLDQDLNLPKRFPSGISIDPSNPNHVFVSYSGYSAYSPGGHVFEVTYVPGGTSTVRDLSSGLGDQPITDIVYVPALKALYASTDFGVLVRAVSDQGRWVATLGLPKVATYGLTYNAASKTLYAATHGRSVWKLAVTGP